MSGPYFLVQLRVQRTRPIASGFTPSWNLGNTWLGEPTLDGGQVFLVDGELGPGVDGHGRIDPSVPEVWGGLRVGSMIAMHEQARVVGHARVLEVVNGDEGWTPEVARFVSQALQFCAVVEKAKSYSIKQRLVITRDRLLELVRAASALPEVTSTRDAGDRPDPPADWPGFDKHDVYWKLADPLAETSEKVAGSLSDDVLDIYQDLQRGLALWIDDAKRAAIWEWRFHFQKHWGARAVDAIAALHRRATTG